MPQVTDNPDGTKTLSVNSSELRMFRSLLVPRADDAKKFLQIVETTDVRAVLSFLRSVVD